MVPKRKRGALAHEAFDPNKSDSEDENFEPDAMEQATSRRSRQKSRSHSRRTPSKRKRNNRYRGSDIESDDDEVSESDEFDEDEENEDEDEDYGETALGRRRRKAAAVHSSYKEPSDDEEDEAEDRIKEETVSPPKKAAMVTLKVPTRGITGRNWSKIEASNPPPSLPRRATRARTAEIEGGEDELMELSTSGRHAVRASASRSPEAIARRPSRPAKGLKAPPTIEEATQESGSLVKQAITEHELAGTDEDDVPLVQGDLEMVMTSTPAEQEREPSKDVQPTVGDEEQRESIEIDEDEDDLPITRRTRTSRQELSVEEDAEGETYEDVAGPSTRSGRLTRTRPDRRAKKVTQEASSDFEPGIDSDEGSGSGSDKGTVDDDGDSTSHSRTRRSTRSKRGSKRSHEDSGDEIELDQEELAEELHELKNSRPSRRRRSPSIQYEPVSKRRRTVREVNYAIQSIPPLNPADDEDDPIIQTPPRGGRRGGRNGGGWERTLNTTFGPFGGGGTGALLGGPWGTGATGGVESDSSDDEIPEKANPGGNVGMTPTTATAPGLVPGAGLAPFTNATPNLGKIKNQKALADADPLGVDTSVDFSKVGGLAGHIDQLKEMVLLPLLYPELFMKFHVTPPRGVLFHGPPGTGKTLLARALSNSIGHNGKKVTFYMRKGADALSKWVGEAEKQLRLLFDEARKNQPSIIFFDEIDGLAPVRSSKQEQIHASIVSTLLALMDGMDGRGQVIVIGATNRPDNIDPALRRPGRFDREFYFPLPDVDARRAILDIHTRSWGLSEPFKKSLADRTKGYAGADLRALCTEAALNAIQRTYPQIYTSQDKLVVDANRISVQSTDFSLSIKKLVPSSERSASSGAAPIPKPIEPLLNTQLKTIKEQLDRILPRKKKLTALEEAMYEPYNDHDHGVGREAMQHEFERARIFRPRLLLAGGPGAGQGYLSSALLHYLEGVHVQNFDLPTLMGDGQPAEQVIVRLFAEVKRRKPSVIYIPNIDVWHATLSASAAMLTFKTMLRSLAPTEPVLVLATSECEMSELDSELIRDVFGYSKKNRHEIPRPNKQQRREFFVSLVQYMRKSPADYPDPANRPKRTLEILPIAPAPPPRQKSKAEIRAEMKQDRQMLNYLKIQLQPIMDQINRKYKKFRQPVIPLASLAYLFNEADPNYVRPDVAAAVPRPYEIIQDKDGTNVLRETATGKTFFNLETTTIEERLSNGYYARPKDFLKDIKALAKDARNIGDRERTLKANELEANVEVDVAGIENSIRAYDWDALYHRQLQRAKAAEEKAHKSKAVESMLGLVQTDINGDGEAGPVTLGALVPGAHTTTARFLPIGGSPAPGDLMQHSASKFTNGTSGSSHPPQNTPPEGQADEDTEMIMDSPMAPPSQWPKIESRPLHESVRATAGNTQVSQRSALTTLPPGMDPISLINEASTTTGTGTTKPSHDSHRSSENWTQRSNGLAPHSQFSPDQGLASQIPDTQPPGDCSYISLHSQSPTSSQQHQHHRYSGSASGNENGSGNSFASSAPRKSVGPTSAPHSMVNLLNNDTSHHTDMDDDLVIPSSLNSSSLHNSSSLRQSEGYGSTSSQPTLLVNEAEMTRFAESAAEKTSGCSVEQLEQIYRDVMDEIWQHRDQWNRMKTLQDVMNTFNIVIQEMEEAGVLPPESQGGSSQRGFF